jgi:UDP:flavonoid glycosyltransferase YjiC (YdhE family)
MPLRESSPAEDLPGQQVAGETCHRGRGAGAGGGEENVLVAVATGGRPVVSLPANARAAEFLPYDDPLPKTDVHVTNGGYGGVQYALRHGVPIVAAGRHEDKPEVIARVAWSGVGRRIRTEFPKPAAVRADRPLATSPNAWRPPTAPTDSPRSSTR